MYARILSAQGDTTQHPPIHPPTPTEMVEQHAYPILFLAVQLGDLVFECLAALSHRVCRSFDGDEIHGVFLAWNGDVDVVSVHQLTHTAALLADDEAVIVEWNRHLLGDRDEKLMEERGEKHKALCKQDTTVRRLPR